MDVQTYQKSVLRTHPLTFSKHLPHPSAQKSLYPQGCRTRACTHTKGLSQFFQYSLLNKQGRINLENLFYVTTLAIASSSQLSKVNLLFSLALCFPWLYNIPKVCTLAIFSYLQPFNPILCVGKNVGEMHNLYSNPFLACKPSQDFCQE